MNIAFFAARMHQCSCATCIWVLGLF